MSKNAKQQLAILVDRRIQEAEAELFGWVDQSWFGSKRKKVIEPLVKQLRYPTLWVGNHTILASVWFSEKQPDQDSPFTIRVCRATMKGFTASFRNKRHVLEIRDHKLYFPKGV